MEIWVEERQEGSCFRVLCRKILFTGKSPYQKVQVVDTLSFGKMLLNDDVVMITERDEFIYHDMIVHVPMLTHPHPKKVLIIGGGDGGTAREVLKHFSVGLKGCCDMVEIDSMVVSACQKHIPQTGQALSDPRLNLYIEDGIQFIKNTSQKYDVIIVDSTDPIGPAVPLFGKEFYSDVFQALTEDGIVVAQAESPYFFIESQKKLFQIYQSLFPISLFYYYGNMTYPGGLWSFIIGSKKYHPLRNLNSDRVNRANIDFQYYNTSIHQASFALPSFVKKQIKTWTVNTN